TVTGTVCSRGSLNFSGGEARAGGGGGVVREDFFYLGGPVRICRGILPMKLGGESIKGRGSMKSLSGVGAPGQGRGIEPTVGRRTGTMADCCLPTSLQASRRLSRTNSPTTCSIALPVCIPRSILCSRRALTDRLSYAPWARG